MTFDEKKEPNKATAFDELKKMDSNSFMPHKATTFDEIKKQDLNSFMHTYNRFDVALEKGRGSTLTDVNGKEYIDFASGIGVNSLGTAPPDWVAAVSAQAGLLAHTSNLYYNLPATKLAARLCEITGFNRAFLANSGAEANEGAIKLARKYSFDKYGKEQAGEFVRNKIVSLSGSFHGRTITTLSATGQDNFHDFFFPFNEGFLYTDANDTAMLTQTLNENEGKICGVMIECVQGEGGVIPLERDFVQAVSKLCAERDILLIVDEVQTGVGRTGKFLASEHYDLFPDIVTLAKGLGGGLPIGAVLCTEALSGVLSAGTHGTTFGGNPVVCAGASVVLDHITAEGFLDEVTDKSNYLFGRLKEIKGVKAVRGLGLMIGLVPEKENGFEIVKACINKGLIPLTAKNAVRLLPPLNITYEEIDKGLAILKSVIEA